LGQNEVCFWLKKIKKNFALGRSSARASQRFKFTPEFFVKFAWPGPGFFHGLKKSGVSKGTPDAPIPFFDV
jgi:hypothetical protein